jgi:hypothetical protein
VQDLWTIVSPIGAPTGHEILVGVSTIALSSSCSIESASECALTVESSESFSIMRGKGHKDSTGRLIQLTEYIPDRRSPATFLIAKKYGAGRIVAIGSWKVFLNEFVTHYPDNLRLFNNIIGWLKKPNSP